jgi:hypothetical protein
VGGEPKTLQQRAPLRYVSIEKRSPSVDLGLFTLC